MSDRLIYVTQVAPYAVSEKRPDNQRRLAGAHHCLPQSVAAMREIAGVAGLSFAHYDDVEAIPSRELGKARVLTLFTIGETPWSVAQRRAIVDRVGRGLMAFMPLHAASDACYFWPEYGRLVGARFDGHPWTQEFGIDVVDAVHPATRHLGAEWRLVDEIYLFREMRPDARILLRTDPRLLDMSARGACVPAFGLPLAWSFKEGRGRVFYTALGHFPALYENPTFLGHIYGGLEWLLAEEA